MSGLIGLYLLYRHRQGNPSADESRAYLVRLVGYGLLGMVPFILLNIVFTGAAVDLADGFIHFSSASQVAETAARHFSGLDDLVLAAIDPVPLGEDLKWETSRGGDLFPHLYRDLKLNEIIWAKPLPLSDEVHQFPDDLA